MQELSGSIKRPYLRIMCNEEGEEVQAKGIYNIFYKIITENFPKLEKVMCISYMKPPGQQTDLRKIELLHDIVSLKQQAQRKENEY
jgi:hypothetical protein